MAQDGVGQCGSSGDRLSIELAVTESDRYRSRFQRGGGGSGGGSIASGSAHKTSC
jgi:hypothetical protein